MGRTVRNVHIVSVIISSSLLFVTCSRQASLLESAYENWRAVKSELARVQSQLSYAEGELHEQHEKLHDATIKLQQKGGFRTDGEMLLDVGGVLFSVPRRLLCLEPSSALAALCSSAVGEAQPVFMDRDPDLFAAVLTFLDTGVLPDSNRELQELYLESALYRLTGLRDAIEARLLLLGQRSAAAAANDDPAAILARALLEAAPSAASTLRSQLLEAGGAGSLPLPASPTRAALVKAAAALARAEAVSSWSLSGQAAAMEPALEAAAAMQLFGGAAPSSPFSSPSRRQAAGTASATATASSTSAHALAASAAALPMSPSQRLRSQIGVIHRDVPEAVEAQRKAEEEARAAEARAAEAAAAAAAEAAKPRTVGLTTSDYLSGSWRQLYSKPSSPLRSVGATSLASPGGFAATMAAPAQHQPQEQQYDSIHALAAATALPDPFGFTTRRAAVQAAAAPAPAVSPAPAPAPLTMHAAPAPAAVATTPKRISAPSSSPTSPLRSPSRFVVPSSAAAALRASLSASSANAVIAASSNGSGGVAALTTADLDAPASSATGGVTGGDNVNLELMLSSLSSLRRQAAEAASKLSLLNTWSEPSPAPAPALTVEAVDVVVPPAAAVAEAAAPVPAAPAPAAADASAAAAPALVEAPQPETVAPAS